MSSFEPSRRVVVGLLAVLVIATTVGCSPVAPTAVPPPAQKAGTVVVSVVGSLTATPTNTTIGNPVTIRIEAEGAGLTLDACLAGACRGLTLAGGEATFVPSMSGEWTVSLRRMLAAPDSSVTLATVKVTVASR